MATELQEEDKKKTSDSADEEDERRHLQIDDMTDILPEMQKPLLCYASRSFRKVMVALKEKRGKATADDMNSVGEDSSELQYDQPKPSVDSMPDTTETRDGPEKVELLLFRKKKFNKFWGYGFSLKRSKGEDDSYYIYVDHADGTVSGKGSLYPGDVVTAVDGKALETLTIDEVNQMLGMGKAEIGVTIVPLSPMRANRIVASKLQEQTITDASVPTRSHAAEVNV